MFGDRLKRLRQEKGLTQEQMREIIIALLIEKGYSEEVLKALSEKDTTQERLLAALKARTEKEKE